MVLAGDRSEIAFFDLESSVPTRRGQGFSILEFGSILVCPRKLVELESYSTLVKPTDLSHISSLSVRRSGITRDAVVSAPSFSLIADKVYDILHGRIWAGHNIVRFDCVRIKEAFAQIDREPPQPKGIIDSLALLTRKFGRRAGDMKMASIATYFGLGQQTHRSLDDVRMNLEVLKYCATVLLLESSLPDIFTANSWVSPNVTTRSRSNGKASPEGTALKASPEGAALKGSPERKSPIKSKTSSSSQIESHPETSPTNHKTEEYHPILSLMIPGTGECISDEPADPFNMSSLSVELGGESLQPDCTVGEFGSESLNSDTANLFEASGGVADFLKLDEISIASITVVLTPIYRGFKRLQFLHKHTPLLMCCSNLKVRFGISKKFVDFAGRPRLNIVVDASPDLCQVLDTCDSLAHRMSLDSGSTSDWRPVVTRKAGFENSPTARLHLPMVTYEDTSRWSTEMYLKKSSSTDRIVFSTYDIAELDPFFSPGTLVDAYFSLDPYDYQQNAGIRLVAKKLIVHSN